MDNLIFWLCLIILAFAVVIVSGVVWFGMRIFYDRAMPRLHDGERLIERLIRGPRYLRIEAAQLLSDSITNYLERRNEYWTTYGQIVLSIFIVTVLAVLLLTKTIDPDAGLPILSGIASFAIAKTVNAANSRSTGLRGEEAEREQ